MSSVKSHFALVGATVFECMNANAVHLVVFEVTFVLSAFLLGYYSFSMEQIVLEPTTIFRSIWQD